MKITRLLRPGILLLTVLIGACSQPPAPVANAWLSPQAQSADYTVNQGDTIYSIAWQFGLDYSALARVNHLQPPYRIYLGQHLQMTTVPRGAAAPQIPPAPRLQVKTKSPAQPVVVATPVPVHGWVWPASGKLVRGYSPTLAGNAGINIAGRLGSPVRAAAAGTIVYAGNGVRGYDNLIIIKHNRHYLSAYAYNQKMRVRLGQQVKAGETIATMGKDDAGQVMLHFEIRNDGRPVDPLHFLR